MNRTGNLYNFETILLCEPYKGTMLYDCARNAVEKSQECNCKVAFVFNGIFLLVDATVDTAETIDERYSKEMAKLRGER